jgi:hypothetical protein
MDQQRDVTGMMKYLRNLYLMKSRISMNADIFATSSELKGESIFVLSTKIIDNLENQKSSVQ